MARQGAYLKLFSSFLAEERSLSRRGSFEYMEILGCDEQESEEKETSEVFLPLNEQSEVAVDYNKVEKNEEYFARINPSQNSNNSTVFVNNNASHSNDQSQASDLQDFRVTTSGVRKRGRAFTDPDMDGLRLRLESGGSETTDSENDEDSIEDDCACPPDIPTSPVDDELTSHPIKSCGCSDRHLASNCTPSYIPSLASIEETDETEMQLPEAVEESNAVLIRSPASMIGPLSSHKVRAPLRRMATVDDLSADECENSAEDSIVSPQGVEANCDSEVGSEIARLFKEVVIENSGEEDQVTSNQVDGERNVAHSSQSLRTGTSQTETRPDSLPVVVVDSLEDYIRSVLPTQHHRSRKFSDTASHASSTTDSAYSSRERISQLHHSTPDIAAACNDDDIELQYLPVSYADVRVKKRRRWVKRSYSDAHEMFYFSGETHHGTKLNSLKKQLVRRISKKYRKPATKLSQEEVRRDEAGKTKESTNISPKTSAIRDAWNRLFGRIRHNRKQPRSRSLHKRTWSLPTQLDSFSSECFFTESESMTDA